MKYARLASPLTKKGRPVAKLVPAESQPEDIFGCLKDKTKIVETRTFASPRY
jgi:antitoxin (DNA-binding transcriptional repressor) of toxin-antitoxin stability system